MQSRDVDGAEDALGDYLRRRRLAAGLSLRQLARNAGVSNPYLSQIERGLRKPSAEILQALARALDISAETLYVRAGLLDTTPRAGCPVEQAIDEDPSLTPSQRHALREVYRAFTTVARRG